MMNFTGWTPLTRVCPLYSVLKNFQKVPGTIRGATSSPLIARRSFDPVLVGWTGQNAPALIRNGTYPRMSLLISNNGGDSFFNAPTPNFIRTPGRLTTTARYQSTVIVGGQIYPNGQQVAYYSSDGGRTFHQSFIGKFKRDNNY